MRDLVARLAGKWSMLVFLTLTLGPHRFSQIHREIPDVSRRMLSQSLRQLERDGLIARRVLPTTPPGVEYRLTALGRNASAALAPLVEWATASHDEVREARTRFDDQADFERV